MVTHNAAIRSMAHKAIQIRDGQISGEYENDSRIPSFGLMVGGTKKKNAEVLFKRTLRDLKSNFFRYMALFLLIITLHVHCEWGTIGSAVSVIESVNKEPKPIIWKTDNSVCLYLLIKRLCRN